MGTEKASPPIRESGYEGDGIAQGGHRADVLARLSFAAIDGVSQHYLLDPDSYPLESVSRQLIDLLRPS